MILKTIIFYLILIIIVRLLGKREVGEISVFDLVIILILADIATVAINDGWDYVIPSILSLFALLFLQKIFAFFSLKFSKVRKILDYSPSIIMFNGMLNIEEMERQTYSIEDLIYQSRERGVMDLNHIKLAILEPTGQLSVFLKKEITKQILPIIVSGSYQMDNMNILEIKKEDVEKYLDENKLMEKDVYYLSSDGVKFFLLTPL